VTAQTAVSFLDMGAAYDERRPELAAHRRVMDSRWYIIGAEVEAFERELAAYCGAKHCVGMANGLDALHLVLHRNDADLAAMVDAVRSFL